MFVQSTKLRVQYDLINSIGCQESVIEITQSNHADDDCVCINENRQVLLLFIFVQSFGCLNVCVQLAQLVWTYSAFTYCDLGDL